MDIAVTLTALFVAIAFVAYRRWLFMFASRSVTMVPWLVWAREERRRQAEELPCADEV